MFLDKYAPKKCSDMFNSRQAGEIKSWLMKWTLRKNGASAPGPGRGRALLVWGPPGTGKSFAARLACKELGYELVESHAIDERTKQGFEKMTEDSRQASIFSRKKAILVDDLETLESKASLMKFMKESMQPIILIAENPYELNMQAAMKTCTLVRFQKASREAMSKFLNYVAACEGMDVTHIDSIISQSDGDVRCALIDMESFSGTGGARLRSSNMHETVKGAFRSGIGVEDVNGTTLAWIGENISQEFRTDEDVANAYKWLGKADMFMSRIGRRQAWSLQKYVPSMLRGMPVHRSGRASLLATYISPPWRAQSGALRKIGNCVHTSSSKAHEYIPIIKNSGALEEMGLDDNDIDFIMSHGD